ncbi:zinc transporter 10 isoform X1 [Electrophorus electricus]|uniref:zinc transporter 10 isoform X1 n=1 Tax=Electrophorus electricus TaxID=8005 RepID=UPI0015CFD5FC|nr:zinc transporter 10 isoform X1 [Electrophorus electricus]
MGRYSGKTCRLIFMLVITVIFFLAEIVAGYVGNSIALVSDAFNMLSDIMSLCVGLASSRISRRAGSGRSTYGYVRAEVVGALANAVFLAALCFSVSVESLRRLGEPEPIDDPLLVLTVGALGLAVNVIGLLIFQDCRWCRGKKGETSERDGSDGKGVVNGEAGVRAQPADSQSKEKNQQEGQPLNIRGVLLHVLNDALGSVVVVVTSTLFYVWPLGPDAPCNWQCYVDPALTLIMVAIIMSSAAPLVKETTSILLQMSPPDLPLTRIVDDVCQLPGVISIHELHVWELAKDRNIATLHVNVSAELQDFTSSTRTLHAQIREVFHKARVHSVTVQMEFGQADQEGNLCSTPCVSADCLKNSCCPGDPKETGRNVKLSCPSTEVAVNMEGMQNLLGGYRGTEDKNCQITMF